jgi:hypothetical protein
MAWAAMAWMVLAWMVLAWMDGSGRLDAAEVVESPRSISFIFPDGMDCWHGRDGMDVIAWTGGMDIDMDIDKD